MQSADIEQTIREYLPSVVHLSLATCRDNRPWASEVHFAYDDQLNLYFRSLASRRHSQEIAANPQVAGAITRQHAANEYPLGVYFEGIAERLGPGEEQNQAFEAVQARFKIGDAILAEARREDGHQFYKITIEKWYVFGKLDGQKGQKYELAWKLRAAG